MVYSLDHASCISRLMSREDTPVPETGAVTISVQKSQIDGLLSAYAEVGLDGEFLWPIPPRSLSLLYRASPEHGRAVHVKAESAYGGGLIGDTEALEALCELPFFNLVFLPVSHC